MSWNKIVCPFCNESFDAPDDRDSIVCMFCGKKILLSDLNGALSKSFDEVAEEVVSTLRICFGQIDEYLAGFNRNNYEESFQSFCEKFRDLSTMLASLNCENDILRKIAAINIDCAETILAGYKKKGAKERFVINLNLFMVAYVLTFYVKIPGNGKQIAEMVANEWNSHFRTGHIEATSYEDINSGFRRKLCYITTAVCSSLGKPEDCDELVILRQFRDRLLPTIENGPAIIHEYYDIAPTIVKRMERDHTSGDLYIRLYHEYIAVCIDMIQKRQYREAVMRYTEMVELLRERYLKTNTK